MANKGLGLQPDEKLWAYWDYPQSITHINRLLKSQGIAIKTRRNYSRWGDLVAVKLVKIKSKDCLTS